MSKDGRAARNLRRLAQSVLRLAEEARPKAHDEALTRALKLYTKNSASPLVLRLLGHLYRESAHRAKEAGKNEEVVQHLSSAQEFLTQASQIQPNCIDISFLLSSLLFEQCKVEEALKEIARGFHLAAPVDPAESNAAYGIGDALGHTANDISCRIKQIKDAAQGLFDCLARYACESIVPAAVREVLQVAVGSNALKMAKGVAKRYYYSARAQSLHAYICVRYARSFEEESHRNVFLQHAYSRTAEAVACFPYSMVAAMFHAKVCFMLQKHEEAVKECHRAISMENPADPEYEVIPFGCFRAKEEKDRVSAARQELQRLLLKFNSGVLSTISDDVIDDMFPVANNEIAEEEENNSIASENEHEETATSDYFVEEETASTSSYQRCVDVLKENNADKDVFMLHLIVQWDRNEYHKTAELLTSLKTILPKVVDGDETFGEVGRNNVSLIVHSILIQLHMSHLNFETERQAEFELQMSHLNLETERQAENPITSEGCVCPIHKLFGITYSAKKLGKCEKCRDENQCTTLFHLLDVGSPQTTKIKSFAKLPVILDEEFHQDNKCQFCGSANGIDPVILKTTHFFTIVLKWSGGSESQLNLSKVLASLKFSLGVRSFCKTIDSATKYNLASMICSVDDRHICIVGRKTNGLYVTLRMPRLKPEVIIFEVLSKSQGHNFEHGNQSAANVQTGISENTSSCRSASVFTEDNLVDKDVAETSGDESNSKCKEISVPWKTHIITMMDEQTDIKLWNTFDLSDHESIYSVQMMKECVDRNILFVRAVREKETKIYVWVEPYTGVLLDLLKSTKIGSVDEFPSPVLRSAISQIFDGLASLWNNHGRYHGNFSLDRTYYLLSNDHDIIIKFAHFRQKAGKKKLLQIQDLSSVADGLNQISEIAKSLKFDCSEIDDVVNILTYVAPVNLENIIKRIKGHPFFWDGPERQSFFVSEVPLAMNNPFFVKKLDPCPELCTLPWNSAGYAHFIKKMNDYWKQNNMLFEEYNPNSRVSFVLFVSGLYTHERELKHYESVDDTVKKESPGLFLALYSLIRPPANAKAG